MLNRFARALFTRLLTPIAATLLRWGVSPDAVTIVGTLGVTAGALLFYPRGEFLVGTLVITAFVFSDTIDGIMARRAGRSSSWGAFLDSSLDRVGDAAVFGGLLLYYAGPGDDTLMTWLAFGALVLGSVVSYVRARAEGLGMRADVGIAERADRLVAVLVVTGLVGVGLPEVALTITLAALVVASAVTVLQRVLLVRRQALAAAGQVVLPDTAATAPGPGPAGPGPAGPSAPATGDTGTAPPAPPARARISSRSGPRRRPAGRRGGRDA